MPTVAVLGGGLAGIATSAALASVGYEVHLHEARSFLGGRATSWPAGGEDSEVIDNCQHVLIRCCHNLLDLYSRLGAAARIHFHRQFFFIEPGGRTSTLKPGILPAPNHFAGSFLRLKFLSLGDKIAIARATRAIARERHRPDLDQISMAAWLHEKRQPQSAIDRYWNPILISAINEDLDRMAAAHAFQVFWLGMLARADSYEMGIPDVPLRDLYNEQALARTGNITFHPRSTIAAVETSLDSVTAVSTPNGPFSADYYVSSLPSERLRLLLPQLPVAWDEFTHSPITGIHLWFDRSITTLPHATLLDRHIQWMFNKSEGRYLQLVVSASRALTEMPRRQVIELAVRELADFFPAVREARLEKAQVIKEVRATFSARPGLEALRPRAQSVLKNLFLAGDWTRSGWPATMEGAVRSGYLAAEAVTAAAGSPRTFLIPDLC